MEFFNSKEKAFWDWFGSNIDWLSDTEQPDYDALLDKMLEELHKYCDKLYFEVGRKSANEIELIITAHGNMKYFNQVEKLVSQAPKYDNWIVTPFMPPMEKTFIYKKDGITVNTDRVFFDPLENKNRPMDLGLQLFIEGFERSKMEDFLNATRIVLQTILGEKSYASDIHHIELDSLPSDYDKYISIKDLPGFIQWRKTKFKG